MHYSKNYEIIFSDLIKDSIRETMDMALSYFLIKQRLHLERISFYLCFL